MDEGVLEVQPIIFPGLGLEFTIDPVAISILGKEIYWYGIIIALGFLLAIIVATNEAKRLKVDPEYIMDIVLWGTPLGIIGARLYYVIFNWSAYKSDFGEIIAIWHGGLAIYGAIIAALISTYMYCSVKKINIWEILDIASLGVFIAQIIGRWGNFVNQEAYGGETALPWRMQIYDVMQQTWITVHPTFLYESLWNLGGLLFVLWYRKKKRFNGQVFLIYTMWYGIGRFMIEGLRADSLYLGSFKVSQLVAIIFILISVGLMTYLKRKRPLNR